MIEALRFRFMDTSIHRRRSVSLTRKDDKSRNSAEVFAAPAGAADTDKQA